MTASNTGNRSDTGLLVHRCAFACMALFVALLTTGCHHKAKVSRHYPPPPPTRSPSRAAPSTSTAQRGLHGGPLPSYAIPDPNVDDNAIASGHTNSTRLDWPVGMVRPTTTARARTARSTTRMQ